MKCCAISAQTTRLKGHRLPAAGSRHEKTQPSECYRMLKFRPFALSHNLFIFQQFAQFVRKLSLFSAIFIKVNLHFSFSSRNPLYSSFLHTFYAYISIFQVIRINHGSHAQSRKGNGQVGHPIPPFRSIMAENDRRGGPRPNRQDGQEGLRLI